MCESDSGYDESMVIDNSPQAAPFLLFPCLFSYKKEIEFTKKEVETLQKRLTLNGDIDFIEMVKMRYQWPLSFLQDSLRYRMSNEVEERDFVEDSEDDDDDDFDL
jgi:hypothetical protein